MYFHLSDTRIPLKPGDRIRSAHGQEIIIDRYVGSGGFSLMYIAHREHSSRYMALKELFPRQLENLLIQRADSGKIVICDPASGRVEPDQSPLWRELRQYFEREAALTRKAGAVYDDSGLPADQNSPDVLHAEGPFPDRLGNWYLSIDTFQGESLGDLIRRGFLRDADGAVVSNRVLEDILDILAETAIRLSALHAAGLWHLDLSPDNIYVVPSAGRTRLTPYIIDYGSAYDRGDPERSADHRYTCNPFSAPEILALAQLQDPACGYAPDPSSDTYALASILFYAVTGQVFTAESRMNCGWQEQLRREYAAGLPSHPGADTFANSLIDFLDRGLAAAQQERLRSCEAFLAAIRSLQSQYAQYGNLLPKVAPDELMSYMVLEKYPLYRYPGGDGNNHVLCLGSGAFVRRMILSLISCGQMRGSGLYIHVVSAEPEEKLRRFLHDTAPLLERYSNPKAAAGEEYVTFRYQQVGDVLDGETCRDVLTRHGDCRYILVSLGSNRANMDAAGMYAQELSRRPNPSKQRAVLLYGCSEDAANNVFALPALGELPEWLEVEAFGRNLSAYSRVIRTLGLRTLKVAHLYNKLDNPRISLAETARNLAGDEYAQRSSCAAALHLKYKLASAGIDPSPKAGSRSVIAAYRKVLADHRFGGQMELEHRRWMMYMIADGFRAPTAEQLDFYGFRMVDGKFNGKWRCNPKFLHPCLVPCGSAGAVLTGADWDRYTTPQAIEAAPFDPLDKLSLTLRMYAEKRCRKILKSRRIDRLFRDIADKLSDARESRPEQGNLQELEDGLKKVQEAICLEARQLRFPGDNGRLAGLSKLFRSRSINISGETDALLRELSVFQEYAARRDYKKPDAVIIRHLLWLLYAENDITCIKLRGRAIADNITGPLILEPHRLVYFGLERRPAWEEFLRAHGNLGEITYAPDCGSTADQITAALKRLAARQRGGCVLDITGADEQMVIAAQRVADANSRVSIIRCTPDGQVENIQRFPTAPAYTLNTTISADEIFSLHGARRRPDSSHDLQRLEEQIPALWSFYRELSGNWQEITAFFAGHGGAAPELYLPGIRIDGTTLFKGYRRSLDRAKWEALALDAVFSRLLESGIIRNPELEEYLPGIVNVSFEYPLLPEHPGRDIFREALDGFFTREILPLFVPLRCEVRREDGAFAVEIRSGLRADICLRQPCDRVIPALKRLEALRQIAELDVSDPVSIRYLYTNPALSTCLAGAENILKLFIWMEAKGSGVFDHALPSLSFVWEEGLESELDVILTRGLTSLMICARTAPFRREQLYELKYLSERFSLNSRPVIVYAPARAEAPAQMDALRQSAGAMGIHWIDLNELIDREMSLGAALGAIADGTAPL